MKIITQKQQAKKTMLWFALVSITMTFAGLTSAYVFSRGRKDWEINFELPSIFTTSTFLLIISSFIFHFSKKYILNSQKTKALFYLFITLILSIFFIIFQFKGFQILIGEGYYFTGVNSTINTSFLYILVCLHLLHLFAGIIILLKVIYKTLKDKYKKNNPLGINLALWFWHFLGFLWIYLFLFLLFV